MVIRKLGDFVFINHGDARSIGAVEVLARRCCCVRIGVVESGVIGCKNRGVRARVFGEPGEGGSVESDAVEMALERRFFCGREIEESLCLIEWGGRGEWP